jgi:hypothetical protein
MRLDLAAYAVERAAQPPFIVDIIVAVAGAAAVRGDAQQLPFLT